MRRRPAPCLRHCTDRQTLSLTCRWHATAPFLCAAADARAHALCASFATKACALRGQRACSFLLGAAGCEQTHASAATQDRTSPWLHPTRTAAQANVVRDVLHCPHRHTRRPGGLDRAQLVDRRASHARGSTRVGWAVLAATKKMLHESAWELGIVRSTLLRMQGRAMCPRHRFAHVSRGCGCWV